MVLNAMKRLTFIFLVLVSCWGLLFIGCGSRKGDGKDELMFALNLKKLPASVRNIQYGEDAWTDYILHVYCEIDPSDFKTLISGRPFAKEQDICLPPDPFAPAAQSNDVAKTGYRIEPPPYASAIPVFEAHETYTWKCESFRSVLQTTKEHDKIYIVHSAD
jgi:hypothetical protein